MEWLDRELEEDFYLNGNDKMQSEYIMSLPNLQEILNDTAIWKVVSVTIATDFGHIKINNRRFVGA